MDAIKTKEVIVTAAKTQTELKAMPQAAGGNKKNYIYNIMNFSLNKRWTENFPAYFGVDNILNKKADDVYIDGRMWRTGREWKF